MEDFIYEIYQYSFIVDDLKEFISLVDSGRIIRAREIYNDVASRLEKQLHIIALNDENCAKKIQEIALKIKDEYEDYSLSKGIISGYLIPALCSYIKSISNINVTEGKYTIVSSDTGFLTIRDNEINKYLHETFDPLCEAGRLAESLYDPSMQSFHIFGCGLGYIPYQIYNKSDSTVNIFIYENDKYILDYAYLYGLLSLIPESIIQIIHSDNLEELAHSFIDNVSSKEYTGFYISPFKRNDYNGLCNNELNRLAINQAFELESAKDSIMNLWSNRRIPSVDFSFISKKFKYEEWIIISAGPSFDDSLAFLKKSKGKRGLIAVNTVLRRLLQEDIVPDIIAAADQFDELVKHIKGIESSTKDIILIADWLLNRNYLSLYEGTVCFVRTNASSKITQDFLPNEPVWDISGTVACLAIEAAIHLRAKTIYLVGQDLAYPSGRKYAKKMPHPEAPEANWEIKVPSVDGSMVDTSEAFDWFRKAIEFQISKYNSVSFINLSKHGAKIYGTKSADPSTFQS